MKRNNDCLIGYPVSQEVVSVSRYLKMSEAEKSAIRTTEIAAPKLGSKSLGGGIIVHYKTPIYRVG